jgi:hypothetical protein
MTARWTTPDGARVDVITLAGTSRGGDRVRDTGARGNGQWLRVTGPQGNYAGQVRTPAELAKLGVTLTDLTEMKEI